MYFMRHLVDVSMLIFTRKLGFDEYFGRQITVIS